MAVAPDDLRVFNFFEKRPTRILRLWFVPLERFVSTSDVSMDGALIADTVCP